MPAAPPPCGRWLLVTMKQSADTRGDARHMGLSLLAVAGLLLLPAPWVGCRSWATRHVLSIGRSVLSRAILYYWMAASATLVGRERRAGGAMREIAVEHASRNPGRNGVTVSALMVGLAIMIGVLMMVRSFRHTVELWVNETVIADMVVAPSTWLRGAEIGGAERSLPPTWLTVLATIPGVAAVDSYRDVRVEVNGQRVAIVSRDLRLHAQRSRYLVRQGDSSEQLVRAADTRGLLVSEVLANRLGVEEGSTLEILTPSGPARFPIVAVFYDYSTDGGKLLMDRALYQSLWHDELVTVFPVYMSAGSSIDRVRERIRRTTERRRRRRASAACDQQH